ncbi:MAG TPA: hypothetical protein VN577_00165 [Terriglobales bacterium]|nr:hypothetical protein [Terriglobales bacterium]
MERLKGDNLGKRVICVSWNPSLSLTRQILLGHLGCRVVSALGRSEALQSCRETADLLVIGHSVPADEKRAVIRCFREHSNAPVLSLITTGQDKLPEANYAVESSDPAQFIHTVSSILR